MTRSSQTMKRKKWTEAEEETLLTAYSDLISSRNRISQLRTREKKFQPIADRVNALHHLLDATAFPFRWTWKDISIKIQNMRHQYINVKLKLPYSSTTNNPDWDHALNLWPNFLHYKTVFGDIDPHPSQSSSSSSSPASENASAGSEDDKVVNLEREMRRQRRREEEERRKSWRRREERRGEEEMEWREKMVRMQMEHEKHVMQMHEETCQAQMQMLGVVVRLVCQFFGTAAASAAGGGGGDGGINGLQHHVMHNLQQQQQQEEEELPGSLVGDNVKNDVNSGDDYL